MMVMMRWKAKAKLGAIRRRKVREAAEQFENVGPTVAIRRTPRIMSRQNSLRTNG